MAQVVVEKSALASFLDELPSLIMQYKAMQWQQDQSILDRRYQEEVKKEERNWQTSLMLLKDSRAMANEARKDLSKKINDYSDIVGSIPNISSDAQSIINSSYEGDITNSTSIVEHYDNKTAVLQNEVYNIDKALLNLKNQGNILRQLQSDYAGANKVLEPHEYEQFQIDALKPIDEGGLGWETTAGADRVYYKTELSARYARALQVTNQLKSDFEKTGRGDYAIMQSLLQSAEGEGLEDLADKLTYKDSEGNIIHRPTTSSLSLLQNLALQTNFKDFVSSIETYPSELGGDQLRSDIESNPNLARIYLNISKNSAAINVLNRELIGPEDDGTGSNYDRFIDEISGVSNQKALFGLYDKYTQGLDPAEHAQYFNAIELASGSSDLFPAYSEFKGIPIAGGIQPETQERLSPRERFDAGLTGGGLFKHGAKGEEPMLNLAGGFLPVPNIEWFLDQEDTLRPSADMPDVPFAIPEALNVSLDKLSKINYEEYLQPIEE